MSLNNIRRYSIKELAERWNCSESTIIHYIEDGDLPIYAKTLLVTEIRPSLFDVDDVDIEERSYLKINSEDVKRFYESAENWNRKYWINNPVLPKPATITQGRDFLLNNDEEIAKAAIENFIHCFTYQEDVEEFELKNGMTRLKPDTEKTEAVKDDALVSHAGTETKERELVAWLRETWINEGKLGGVAFFAKLKKYVNKTGSPIVEHYSAGKDAGFSWKTSAGTTGRMTKKTVLNKVSIFNSKP